MVLFSLGLVPVHLWLDRLQLSTNTRIALGVIAAVFFAVSVRLIFFAFRGRDRGQAVMHESSLGEIRISLDAVENLVRKVARGVKGVREMKADVTNTNAGLAVELKGIISPEVSIPEVSEEIQSAVKSYVRRVVGVEVAEVRIKVENIATDVRRRLD